MASESQSPKAAFKPLDLKSQAVKPTSLFARQTVFVSPEDAAETSSTLYKADASVFHPMPEPRSPQMSEAGEPNAYEAGFTAGKNQTERMYKETITMMENVLSALKNDISAMTRDIEASHNRAIVQSLRALLPDLAEQTLITEMARIIKEANQTALEGQISVRIHPENRGLSQYFDTAEHADISILYDEKQSLTGLAFIWQGGGVDLDPIQVSEACLSLLDPVDPSLTDTVTPNGMPHNRPPNERHKSGDNNTSFDKSETQSGVKSEKRDAL